MHQQFSWWRAGALGLSMAAAWPVCLADTTTDCDLMNGEKIFHKCAVCHSVLEGEAHGAGPNLHGVADRTVGKVEGFKFSKRMRLSVQTWTDAHLGNF